MVSISNYFISDTPQSRTDAASPKGSTDEPSVSVGAFAHLKFLKETISTEERKLANKILELCDCDAFSPPNSCGVYIVTVRNLYPLGAEHILYIGSTANLQTRRTQPGHPYLRCRKRFQNMYRNVAYRYFEIDNYAECEELLIKIFRPVLNKRHNPRNVKQRTIYRQQLEQRYK